MILRDVCDCIHAESLTQKLRDRAGGQATGRQAGGALAY